jgi:hypothetical protein
MLVLGPDPRDLETITSFPNLTDLELMHGEETKQFRRRHYDLLDEWLPRMKKLQRLKLPFQRVPLGWLGRIERLPGGRLPVEAVRELFEEEEWEKDSNVDD